MWLSFWKQFWAALLWWGRPVLKGILRRCTGLCELQRICYGEPPGAARAISAERSLRLSRMTAIHAMISHLDDVANQCRLRVDTQTQILSCASVLVMQVKRINPRVHPTFSSSFERCVQLVWGYRQLYSQVEQLRTTQYDSDNLMHEQMLLDLWKQMMPQEPLEGRITKQWQDIGFQVVFL
jgi:ELMO domain-containing protein